MLLKVKKETEELVIKIMNEDTEENFDYIKMINELYNQDEVELTYEDDISEEDRVYISNLFAEISSVATTEESQE
ncbi:MAG: hypothetical protein KJ847_06415 [Firmicutes bacterium]|nr:hypothetical protein [Bacillota bacterium]